MTENEKIDAKERYQIKRFPSGLIRVLDSEKDRVDGVWDQKNKVWLDVDSFIESGRDLN